MNNQRRKNLREITEALSELKDRLDALYQEEVASFENTPANFYDSERYDLAEQICDKLSYTVEQLEDSIRFISSVIE